MLYLGNAAGAALEGLVVYNMSVQINAPDLLSPSLKGRGRKWVKLPLLCRSGVK